MDILNLIEQYPHHLQERVMSYMEKFEGALHDVKEGVQNQTMDQLPPYLKSKLERIAQVREKMRERIELWKEQAVQKLEILDEERFDWLDMRPIMPNETAILHYTPRWPMIIHFVSAMICFGCSAVYHLFNSHSKKTMTFFIKFDYAGICVMISGSSAPPIYYSFACQELEHWRTFYLAFMYAMCSLTLCVMMFPFFDKDEYNALRGYLFLVTGLSSIIPVLHIIFMIDADYLYHFHLTPWIIGGAFYVIGVFFYITQWPECRCKNTFDIFGSSHQIFHVCIILAALTHYYGSVQVFHDRQLYSCPLPNNLY
uniref:Uncharacterized protein n=1 Tax=Strombidium rassoulzadegani TaxID=1082188 RepID=A0A7S3CPH7_9SPIT|mmetsp:Transcript_2099/g.3707  ORF Transcript_2099/g.3707 Transcript_2099/m.3707 type:complete len:312 (+) Transcript_2099:1101-2036(+)